MISGLGNHPVHSDFPHVIVALGLNQECSWASGNAANDKAQLVLAHVASMNRPLQDVCQSAICVADLWLA
jgi:hypothetical protein